jgi:geranylgeranyl diphosphate synthase type I
VDQAINAGLALSCYARLALLGMAERPVSPGTFLEIQRLLEHTVIDLSRGQYLDIHFQQRSPDFIPTLHEYLEMVRLKTGMLLGTACEVGALVAGAQDRRETARRFGEGLGVAFQLQDDILGTWGDPAVTGKSSSDISEGKPTLPVVLAMEQELEELRPLLQAARAGPDGVERLRDTLTSWGVLSQAEALVEQHQEMAAGLLEGLCLDATWEKQFKELSGFLVTRAF